MGSKAPPAPPPPDPYVTAAAQTQGDVQSAIANAALGNVNTWSPYGTSVFTQTGTQQITDAKGNVIDVPRYTHDITLNPAQQALLDQETELDSSLNQFALGQVGRISNVLSSPFTTDGMAPQIQSLGTGPQVPGNSSTYQMPAQSPTFAGPTGTPNLYLPDGTPQFRGYGNAPTLNQVGPGPNLSSFLQSQSYLSGTPSFSGNANFQNVSGGGGNYTTVSGDGGGFSTVGNAQPLGRLGSAPQLQQLNDTTGPQFANTPNGPQLQTDLSTTPIQRNVNLQNGATTFADAGDITRTVGADDFSADRQRVEQSILSRLNPEFERQRAALETQLANQGIALDSEAYRRGVDEINRSMNDARMQAVLAGGQEQSRMFGMDLNRGQFQNAAQQQAYSQAQGRGLFGLNALAMNNQNALASGNFANAAQAQGFGQNLAQGQFGNQAAQQMYDNAFANTQANNASAQQAFLNQIGGIQANNAITQQGFQNQQDTVGFNNAASNSEFQNQLAGVGLNNASAQQAFANQIAAAQSNNQAASSQASNAIAAAQLNNAAAQQSYMNQFNASQQGFQNQMALQGANNAAAQQNFMNLFNTGQQGFQNQLAGAGFNNDAILQQYNANLAAQQANNQLGQQSFENVLAGAGFNNQALQQDYANRQGAFDIYNQLLQQNYGNQQASADAYNNLLQQQFGNQQTAAAFQNTARQAGLQEQFAIRNQPINEITALMGAGQVNMPQFAGWNAPQVPGSTVGQNIYNSAALQQQQWQTQANMAAQNNAGLFGLGSAFLGGMGRLAFSDRRLKRDIVDTGIRLTNGLPLYQYRYANDNVQRIGLMADEVERIHPEAVVTIDGYKAVNYIQAAA